MPGIEYSTNSDTQMRMHRLFKVMVILPVDMNYMKNNSSRY